MPWNDLSEKKKGGEGGGLLSLYPSQNVGANADWLRYLLLSSASAFKE